ncbi:cell division protein FtsN [Orbus hercynius]|uniref:Cell division protein FtsN n=1 Tax=Orbus hercynius TaxID=593135 RepID=A0A495RGG6_9GAMM|nr:SPOR domain-containing protein [Orbus hercynius]RKS85938.1 cell division protein FtsN [Orbus hercynius]
MAQRDYVKKKTKAKSNSRIIPNLMMAIAVILVILFVAILYFVSTNKTKKPVIPTANVTERPQATLPDKPEERWTYLKELENPDGDNQILSSQIPPSAQEKERQKILDSFSTDKQIVPPKAPVAIGNAINSVQNNTQAPPVKIEPPKTQSSSSEQTGTWLLQCGAFKDKGNAESLKAKLAMIGVSGFVKNEKFYRVLVGPYPSKAEADKVVAMLKSNGTTSCITTQK